jgi:hypothetical protein
MHRFRLMRIYVMLIAIFLALAIGLATFVRTRTN